MSSSNNFYCPICFESILCELSQESKRFNGIKPTQNIQKFNKTCHQPISVDCGHTFCLYCLEQMVSNTVKFECVICRRAISCSQFNKNILVIELLEHSNNLGVDEPCMELDCSICNPNQGKRIENRDEEEEISEHEMIDQLIEDLETFLHKRPETIAFMLEGNKRRAERRLVDAFFELLDECADERSIIISLANEIGDQETDEQLRQVELYVRQFETLCVYMIASVLRLRTLNSFTAYSLQRIRAYFPLRNQLEFVELTHENEHSNRHSSESLNSRRLEERLQRQSNGFYGRVVTNQQYRTSDNECDFIEYIPSAQLYHCLICNTIIRSSTTTDTINQHIHEPAHQFLIREVDHLPLEILRRRSNAYRINQINILTQRNNNTSRRRSIIEESQSRPSTTQRTTHQITQQATQQTARPSTTTENRHPTFFS